MSFCKTFTQSWFFKSVAIIFSLDMMWQDGFLANRKKAAEYSWIYNVESGDFYLNTGFAYNTVSPCENGWLSLMLAPHLENKEVGEMTSKALPSFNILWCQEYGLLKSHWADLGNYFMPVNHFLPFSGTWSEEWFHIIKHEYVSLGPCFIETKCRNPFVSETSAKQQILP